MAEIIKDSEQRECKQVLSLLTGFIDNCLKTTTITNIQIMSIIIYIKNIQQHCSVDDKQAWPYGGYCFAQRIQVAADMHNDIGWSNWRQFKY